jgi:hypothetical protein
MSNALDHPSGFTIKTGDSFACGLLDINWALRTLEFTGISGQDDEMDPHDVWLALKSGPPDGVDRSALVVFELQGHGFQLAQYDLKEFEKECYGPVAQTNLVERRME